MVYPVLAKCRIGKEISTRDTPTVEYIFACFQMEISILITQLKDGKKKNKPTESYYYKITRISIQG